ncbi:MAG: hypothetical protein AAF744_14195 [Pseudomonadota bacterium]
MIDFVFAMIAAGAGGGGGDATAEANAAAALSAPQTAQVAPAEPTVTLGEGTSVGSNVTVGGAAQTGGFGLLAGTSEQSQTAATPAPEPAPPATVSVPAAAPQLAPQAGFNMAVVPAGLVAEDQTPSGKFTTAAEVKPILGATKGNWVAVREYDGSDWLYVTHLFSWRCGLHAMAISINDEPMQNWPLPPCHTQFTTPNALLEDDGLPALKLRLGSVQKIDIQIVYDDLSMEAASFQRGNVLIP